VATRLLALATISDRHAHSPVWGAFVSSTQPHWLLAPPQNLSAATSRICPYRSFESGPRPVGTKQSSELWSFGTAGATLVLLAVYRHALPALPISVALGMVFYFSTRLLMEPLVVGLSTNLLFF
jgi:hypothetical protein